MLSKIIDYFKGVKSEFLKITWPTKKEAFKYVAIVIVVSILSAAYMGVIDFVFVNLFLQKII
ncbi:Protein translocase subunit SecE [bacterium HR34]|nr:Protein translocase subunit SecE [bacterium HR34]